MSSIIVGHKNPDNDAISAAVGYAYLKNELARRAGEEAVFEPVRLGPLPPETEWIMGERGIEQPRPRALRSSSSIITRCSSPWTA